MLSAPASCGGPRATDSYCRFAEKVMTKIWPLVVMELIDPVIRVPVTVAVPEKDRPPESVTVNEADDPLTVPLITDV